MTQHQPEVNPSSLYSPTEACRILEISRSTLYAAIKCGARCGGIDARTRRSNGRKVITGKEILRYWAT